MTRTVNEKRPGELRDAIVQYLIKRGITDFSLRPLAKAVGASPRVLLYYFGSKEKMIVKVLAEVRELQRAVYDEIPDVSFEESCRAIWKSMTAPDSEPLFRLFFEVYGLALRHPQRYKDFLRSTVGDWLEYIAVPLCRSGCERKQARVFATVVLAGFRGFLLDYCTTHDRKRLDHAVDLWLKALNSIQPDAKES
jgi:AcrR family transcriptional regulator